jgi:multiple sugar transport system ATP-binding protein
VGSPLELYDYPANLFVAGFIGSPAMNVIGGKVSGGGFIGDDGTRIALPFPVTEFEGGEMKLGIRPEHLLLDANGHAAEIITIEPTGAETQVLLRLAGHDIIGVFRERILRKPGEILHVSLLPERIQLFDGKSGQRIDFREAA